MLEAIGVGVGAVIGVVAAAVAARRAAAQPVWVDVEAEAVCVAGLRDDPGRAGRLGPNDLTRPEYVRIWAVLAAGGDATHLDPQAAAVLAALDDAEVDDAAFAAAAARVLDAAADRERFNGASRLVPTGDPDAPLRRTRMRLNGTRVTIGALVGAVAGGVGAAVTDGVPALVAVWVLSFAAVEAAFVDADTMYLDTPIWWPACALAWGATAWALVDEGRVGALGVGLATVAGLAVALFLADRTYRAVRGVSGLGSGDTMILVGTAGVPGALTGSIAVGFWAFLAALVLAVAVELPRTIRAGSGVDAADEDAGRQPFALGPFLAVGWIVALAARGAGLV